MLNKPNKEELEKDYHNMTNILCCRKYDIVQKTLLRWVDDYEIKKKGSPGQGINISGSKIKDQWWLIGIVYHRVLAFTEDSFLVDGKWFSKEDLIKLEYIK